MKQIEKRKINYHVLTVEKKLDNPIKILNDLQIVIDALNDKEKCSNIAFQKIWRNKYYDVKLRINKLNNTDYKEVESKYQKWYKEKYK
jgi:hypothetical protein